MRRLDFVSNLVWPVLLIVAAGLWLVYLAGGLSPVALDLIERGWPAVLVAVGLMALIGRRARYGNALAVGAALLLVGGVAVMAYGRQAGQVRTDYIEPVNITLPPEVNTLRAIISVRQTEVEIRQAEDNVIRGEFSGSTASIVSVEFAPEGATGNFTLRETQRSAVPMLSEVGRGKLTLTLPAGAVYERLEITVSDGNLTLGASTLRVRALSLSTETGNVSVTFAPETGLIGDIRSARGDVSVTIPPALAAQIALRGSGADRAQFSDAIYTLRIDKVLVPKSAADPQMQLTIDAAGQIVIQ